jgi:hypothetical protein
MWIKFWAIQKTANGEGPPEEKYIWHDKLPSKDELEDYAEELAPEWMQHTERGFKYGWEVVDPLPEEIRQKLALKWIDEIKRARRMLVILGVEHGLEISHKGLTDIHTETVAALGGDMTEENRRKAKEINFHQLYGGTASKQVGEIEIVQPVGNCDGSKVYAWDKTKEDGRGAKLAKRCPGCRACS